MRKVVMLLAALSVMAAPSIVDAASAKKKAAAPAAPASPVAEATNTPAYRLIRDGVSGYFARFSAVQFTPMQFPLFQTAAPAEPAPKAKGKK
jgi:hypothetical protein